MPTSRTLWFAGSSMRERVGCQDVPKSERYAGPVGEARRVFEGLMSRWIIPSECKYSSAEKISWKHDFVREFGTEPEARTLASVRGMKGNTRTSLPSLSLKVEIRGMMDLWDIWERILISRRGLWGSTFRVSVMTFRATVVVL